MAAQQTEHSPYDCSTAEEAFDDWRRKTIWAHVLGVAGIAVATWVYLAQTRQTFAGFLLLLVVTAGIAVAVAWCANRLWADVVDIAARDCDPQKCLEVVDRVTKMRRGRGFANTSDLVYAACSQLLGYDDIALAWAEKASENAPRPAHWVQIIGVRLDVAVRAQDWCRVQQLRDQALQLAHDLEDPHGTDRLVSAQLQDLARDLVSQANEGLYRANGNWSAALEEVGRLEAGVDTPLAEMENAMRRAKVLELVGMPQLACGQYELVAAGAGTCAMRAEAQRWLDAHPRPEVTQA